MEVGQVVRNYLLKDIEPKISLISSGKNNKYHLPNLMLFKD